MDTCVCELGACCNACARAEVGSAFTADKVAGGVVDTVFGIYGIDAPEVSDMAREGSRRAQTAIAPPSRGQEKEFTRLREAWASLERRYVYGSEPLTSSARETLLDAAADWREFRDAWLTGDKQTANLGAQTRALSAVQGVASRPIPSASAPAKAPQRAKMRYPAPPPWKTIAGVAVGGTLVIAGGAALLLTRRS